MALPAREVSPVRSCGQAVAWEGWQGASHLPWRQRSQVGLFPLGSQPAAGRLLGVAERPLPQLLWPFGSSAGAVPRVSLCSVFLPVVGTCRLVIRLLQAIPEKKNLPLVAGSGERKKQPEGAKPLIKAQLKGLL